LTAITYFKLGLSPGEPAERIRQVFREQVNLYHPERLGSTRLRFFEELVRACHALSNPERRPEYDHARPDTEPRRYAKSAQAGPVAGGLRGLPRISPTLPVRVIFSASIFEVALARASRNLVTGTIDEAISPEGFDLDNDHNMVRIDMSEYQERHTVARLVGASGLCRL
jgi:curved DNA-binding protein CbpA